MAAFRSSGMLPVASDWFIILFKTSFSLLAGKTSVLRRHFIWLVTQSFPTNDVRGEETRDEAQRTSAWGAILKSGARVV